MRKKIHSCVLNVKRYDGVEQRAHLGRIEEEELERRTFARSLKKQNKKTTHTHREIRRNNIWKAFGEMSKCQQKALILFLSSFICSLFLVRRLPNLLANSLHIQVISSSSLSLQKGKKMAVGRRAGFYVHLFLLQSAYIKQPWRSSQPPARQD